ncbi:hypothetical protein KEM48_008456 [Puccinia striiformis f. sp. tritici PST-130]|nr:hypothetical protein KEM48_008456 [Puccinia striiformis f. sp. tritici PST-130]
MMDGKELATSLNEVKASSRLLKDIFKAFNRGKNRKATWPDSQREEDVDFRILETLGLLLFQLTCTTSEEDLPLPQIVRPQYK